MSFQQGLSGLNTTSKSLEVIGNNIANANTYGAKGSRAEFADVYAAALNGAGTNNVGIGVSLAAVSQQFTVIEVAGLDRPGLLFELTSTLSDLNLDIASAHVTTFGEKAVDVFYVTDLTNKKITSPQRQKAIQERLLGVLGGAQPVPAGTGLPAGQ